MADAVAVQSADEGIRPHLVVENVGQFAEEARYMLQQGEVRIWLARDAIWLTVPDPRPATEQLAPDGAGAHPWRRVREARGAPRPGTALRFTFPGANPAAALEPVERVATQVSYLTGSDPAGWQRDVPVWSGVRYRDLLPGIDLVIGDGAPGAVPWRLEARQGASLEQVTLRVEGVGAVTAAEGRLLLNIRGRAVNIELPTWSLAGAAGPVGSAVVAQAGDGALALAPAGAAAAASPAEIAASVAYTYYLNGSLWDTGYAIAVDYLGRAYITGETQSPLFPGAVGSYNGATDAFVARVNAAGTDLEYFTYLGGTGLDLGNGIAVNGDLAYMVGETQSASFLGTTGSAGNSDIVVVALNAQGDNIRYVSRLGGDGFDVGYGITVDGTGTYLTGRTSSSLPTGTACAGTTNDDLVVVKLDVLGAPSYITCVAGSGFDAGYAIAVRDGVAYVTGESASTDFPAPTNPGAGDIVIAIFDANGTRIRSRLFGGALDEWGNGIAVAADHTFYIAGTTYSSAFPGVSVGWGGGMTDAVLVTMDSLFTSGSYFATFVGGNGDDDGNGLAIDTVGGLYMGGTTTSTNFAGIPGGGPAGSDAFAVRMHLGSAAPNKVTDATYVGGPDEDEAYGAATDTGGHAFVTGVKSLIVDPDGTSGEALIAKALLANPPNPPVVTIVANGDDASLNWTSVTGAVKYQVFGSSSPYFTPGDWTSDLPLGEPTGLSFPLTGALAVPGSQFYIVKAVSAAPAASANSNRLGKFTYQLVQGTP